MRPQNLGDTFVTMWHIREFLADFLNLISIWHPQLQDPRRPSVLCPRGCITSSSLLYLRTFLRTTSGYWFFTSWTSSCSSAVLILFRTLLLSSWFLQLTMTFLSFTFLTLSIQMPSSLAFMVVLSLLSTSSPVSFTFFEVTTTECSTGCVRDFAWPAPLRPRRCLAFLHVFWWRSV